jgi:hypothetical protein
MGDDGHVQGFRSMKIEVHIPTTWDGLTEMATDYRREAELIEYGLNEDKPNNELEKGEAKHLRKTCRAYRKIADSLISAAHLADDYSKGAF